MAARETFSVFHYATDDLASGAAGDNTAVFIAPTKVQIVEVGVLITTNLVPGAASVSLIDFDITSASIGPTGAEVTAPTRGSSSATIVTSSSNVTHQDGKILSKQVDFTMEKGETLTCQVLGGTSGNGTPYIIYELVGQSTKEPGEQRSGVAAE
jgi:hypothetical protein